MKSSLDKFSISNYKDQLIYGGAYLFWSIISFVEIGAYNYTIQLTLSIFLMTSLFTILAIGSQTEKFNPQILIKFDFLKKDWRYLALAGVEFMKLWVCFKTLLDTNSLSSWFFLSQGDALFIYLYNFAKTAASIDEGKTSIEITQQKFIGISLWIIAYFLALIFGSNLQFTIMTLLIFAFSLAETVILKIGSSKKGKDDLSIEKNMPCFNFDDVDTKINYAKAKFVFTLAFGALCMFYGVLFSLITGKGSPKEEIKLEKSFVLFLFISVLTLVKDKYEKQVLKKKQQERNFLGRAVYGPLVFLCFTLFMLNKLSAFILFLHLLFLVSYAYFYYEDLKKALGIESIFPSDENRLSIASKFGEDSLIYDFVKTCYENSDSRKIAIFFLINLSFMFVELVYGYISNSLGLITDSFHMLFDCMALFIGLCASYIAKMQPNKQFSYGYGRVETLSGLFNGIFLVFIAFNVFCESIERIYEPQKIETDGLLLVSFLGFLVNLVGLFFFHEHHDHGGHNHGAAADGHQHHHHHDEHENENMYGVFLHVLADCLGSVGVMFSSILVRYYKLYVADPICSFIISLMILASAVPFIQMTAANLILKSTTSLKKKHAKIEQKIEQIEGVQKCTDLQIWESGKRKFVGVADIQVGTNANRSMIHDEVSTILRANKVKDVTVQMVGPASKEIIVQVEPDNKKNLTNTEDDLNRGGGGPVVNQEIAPVIQEQKPQDQAEKKKKKKHNHNHSHAGHNHGQPKNATPQDLSIIEGENKTVSEELGLQKNKRHKD